MRSLIVRCLGIAVVLGVVKVLVVWVFFDTVGVPVDPEADVTRGAKFRQVTFVEYAYRTIGECRRDRMSCSMELGTLGLMATQYLRTLFLDVPFLLLAALGALRLGGAAASSRNHGS